MSDYYVYLTVPAYLKEWMIHTFGDPVILIKDCPESRVLNELLVKTPEGCLPDTGKNANIRIVIPYFKGKDPREYNYLYKTGKNALIESFKTLFKKNIMKEVGELEYNDINCKIHHIIYAFMEKHGINEIHFDTVSQIYYRTRKQYFRNNGIKI